MGGGEVSWDLIRCAYAAVSRLAVVQMQDIFTFNRTHTDPDGAVHGEFRATGLRPRVLDEMKRRGIEYDTANFDPNRVLGN